jgi:hypothetical protein
MQSLHTVVALRTVVKGICVASAISILLVPLILVLTHSPRGERFSVLGMLGLPFPDSLFWGTLFGSPFAGVLLLLCSQMLGSIKEPGIAPDVLRWARVIAIYGLLQIPLFFVWYLGIMGYSR